MRWRTSQGTEAGVREEDRCKEGVGASVARSHIILRDSREDMHLTVVVDIEAGKRGVRMDEEGMGQ